MADPAATQSSISPLYVVIGAVCGVLGIASCWTNAFATTQGRWRTSQPSTAGAKMTYEERVRLVHLVDTALALCVFEIGESPQLSFDPYRIGVLDGEAAELVFEVRETDAYLFERVADPLIADYEMRELLLAALPELGPAHRQFLRTMLEREASELDEELERRGLSGAGLNLKEGGQRQSLSRFARARRWARNKWFGGALKWTDIVLGSLSSIPGLGLVVDPLKEWKESVEAQLDAERGARRRR